MKLYIFSALFVGSALCISAETVKTVAPSGHAMTSASVCLNGQSKRITAPDNTFLWGYYGGAEFSENANLETIGYGSPDDYQVGIAVPNSSDIAGTRLKGIVAPITLKSVIVGDLKVEVYSSTYQLLGSQTFPHDDLKDNDFNYIMFDEPVTMDRPCYVCTRYTTTGSSDEACYPIWYDTKNWKNGSLVFGSGSGQWADYGSQFGSYAMMLILGSIDTDEVDAVFETTDQYTVRDTDVEIPFDILSNSGMAVENLQYTITVGDNAPETRTVDVVIPAGASQKTTLAVPFHTPATSGDYKVRLAITQLNGQDNLSGSIVTTASFHNVSHFAKRCVVMEEFTGTYCGWCPRGWAAMKRANEMFPDEFIGIAIHQYNSSDPMYIDIPQYPLYFAGAPSCYLDRIGNPIDPFYGFGGYGGDSRITDDIAARLQETALVELQATATYTDDSRSSVTVNGSIEALTDNWFDIVFVLTADGIESDKSNFQQGNYYYQKYTMADYADEPYLAMWCEGGEYGDKFVNVRFDDVALATSYVGSVNTTDLVNLKADESAEFSFTLSMPDPATKKDLCEVLAETGYQVNAVVIACAPNGTVANAIKVPVTFAEGVTSLNAAPTSSPAFSLDGRRASTPSPIVIENGKKILR